MDLTFQSGSIFGLLGPNGAGKTTLVSMISILPLPDKGQSKIGDFHFIDDVVKIRDVLGYVPQELALYELLTAKENLSFFGKLHGLCGGQLKK